MAGQYPQRRRWQLFGAGVAALALVVAIAVAIAHWTDRGGTAEQGLTGAATKAAIQRYLTALSDGDTDTVARNALCGMYDAVRDHRSDRALAKLSSNAFRKQFSKAEVTSIDKIVHLSSHQAQVLFTMRVVPVAGGRHGGDQQAVAQVLAQDNQLLVCSYVQRTAAQY